MVQISILNKRDVKDGSDVCVAKYFLISSITRSDVKKVERRLAGDEKKLLQETKKGKKKK